MFSFSQTALKDLEKEQTCPVRWKARWIDKEITSEPTEAMVKGIFFETLALGSGVGGKEVNDLPRLKSGKKSTDQIRIERQAEKVSAMLFNKEHPSYLGVEVTDVQLRIENGLGNGGLDFLGQKTNEDGDLIPVIGDTKLTAKIKGFGEYDWSKPDQMDLTQQVFYDTLFRVSNKYDGPICNLLIVADYSVDEAIKVIEVEVTEAARENLMDRVFQAREVVTHYTENGWSYYPSYEECKDCPLKCDKRIQEKPIEYERIKL